MRRSVAPLVAGGLGCVVLALAGGNLAIRIMSDGALQGKVSGHPIAIGGAVGAMIVWTLGTLIVRRLPRNVVGWSFIAASVVLALGGFAEVYSVWSSTAASRLPAHDLFAWLNVHGGSLFWSPLFGLLLFYPDGRPPPGRWRYVVHATVLVLVTPFVAPFTVPAMADLFWFAMMIVLALSAAAVVARFRRSTGIERQQMKWIATSGALVLVGVLVVVATIPAQEEGLDAPWMLVGPGLIVLGFASLPIAATIAITRYRLYELDRLVSRAVTYGAVIAVVAALYLGSVLGVGAIIPGARDSDLAVALSTLVAAAAFMPLQRRIKVAVDRRFHRQRYDAVRALEQLGARLRDQVDDAVLVANVSETLAATLKPSHVSVWMRSAGGA